MSAAPLRVGLVIGQLTAGGAEGQLSLLARRLADTSCQPVVYCMSEKSEPHGGELEQAGIPLRIMAGPRVRRVRRLAAQLSNDRIQLLHSWLYIGNTYAWLAGRLHARSLPLITSARNCKRQGRVNDLVNRLAFRASSLIIVNSGEVGSYIQEHYRAPRRRIEVVYNGVDVDRFHPGSEPPTGPLVVGLGRLVAQKDPFMFLNAAIRLGEARPDVRFHFAGDGPLREPLAAAVEAAGLGSRFALPGATRDVPELLRRASLFWLTSAWEGLPNVVLEAMASGVPVIAADVGGTRELLRSGVEGFLIAPGDSDALVHYSRALLADETMRHAFAQRARQRALQFAVDRMIDGMERVYGQVAQAAR